MDKIRIVTIITFLVTLVGIAVHCIAYPVGKERRWRPVDVLKKLVHLLVLFFPEQRLSLVQIFRKLLYLLTLLCFVVLFVTGFYPVLVYGEHLSGYLLMVHATFAPVFAICLAVLSVMWAHNCRFGKGDWPGLQRVVERLVQPKAAAQEAPVVKSCLGQKITFWLIVILAMPVTLSIMLSMLPLFGTHMQESLLDIHRHSAWAFSLAAIIHTYLIIRMKMEE